jgi:hypothetical protein
VGISGGAQFFLSPHYIIVTPWVIAPRTLGIGWHIVKRLRSTSVAVRHHDNNDMNMD